MNPDSLTPESGVLTYALQFISHTEIFLAFSCGVKDEIDWETCRFFCFSIILYSYFIIYFGLRWVLRLHGLFSGCGKQSYSLGAVQRLLTAVASLAEHRL